MLIAWVVLRNRMLKTVECRGPKFHAIQIAAQTLQRFDQVAHDHICCRFRHCDVLVSYPTLRLFRVKRRHAVLFPKTASGRMFEMRFADRPASASVRGRGQCSGFDFDHAGKRSDLAEQRGIRARHPRLRAELGEFAIQRQAARGIEMRENLVEQ